MKILTVATSGMKAIHTLQRITYERIFIPPTNLPQKPGTRTVALGTPKTDRQVASPKGKKRDVKDHTEMHLKRIAMTSRTAGVHRRLPVAARAIRLKEQPTRGGISVLDYI